MLKSKTYIATPPGATIKEQLTDRDMTQKEFAARMGLSEKHVSKLINGEVQLTSEVALRLEMVLGIPARFWNNLESIYREKIALVRAENEMAEDVRLAKKFPYKEMAKYGWVPEESDDEGRVIALRKYFELAKLTMLLNPIPGIAYRRQAITKKADYALLAWAQKAKIEAKNIETKATNLQKLESSLLEIRAMTVESPDIFCPRLIDLLSECGIALVFLPHIGGSFLHGATFMDKNKIVIGLTVRGKDADKFWFSLFHELAHVLKGHIFNSREVTEDEEHDANVFAQEILIPSQELYMFAEQREFSVLTLKEFAQKEGVDVGILVGRLQKEGYLPYSRFNDLKRKYATSETYRVNEQ